MIGRTHDELASALEAFSKLVLALRIKNPVLKIFVGGHIAEDCEDTLSLMDECGVPADYATTKHWLTSAVARRAAI